MVSSAFFRDPPLESDMHVLRYNARHGRGRNSRAANEYSIAMALDA
jgi:hypothetical protein